VEKMLSVSNNIHAMRDATRGGVATVLNEIANDSKVSIIIIHVTCIMIIITLASYMYHDNNNIG
jgi:hydrogenase maturation factor